MPQLRRWTSACFRTCVYRGVVLVAMTALGAVAGCSRLLTDPLRFGEVSVSVVRFNGEPVPGAILTLYTGDRPVQYAKSGSDGRFTFAQVPFGLYGVTVFPPDGYSLLENVVGGPGTNVRANVQVMAAETLAPIQFKLLRAGPGAVFVEAREPDGTPVDGIQVSLYTATAIIDNGVTGLDGRVTFVNVPLGAYGVNLKRRRGFYDYGENPYRAIDSQLIESGTLDTVKVTLTRCRGSVRARVRDEAGNPVKRIGARLYSSDGPYATVETDDNGLATFPQVDCGEYGVLLGPLFGYSVAAVRGQGFIDGVAVSRAAPNASAALAVRTDICGGAIRAQTVDAAGLPVRGASVRLYTGAGDYRDGLTDAAGSIVFDQLPCSAEYGVKVVPPAGYTVVEGRGSSYFDAITPTGGNVLFRLQRS